MFKINKGVIILLILSIISIIFVYNDDFLYSKSIMKITKIDTISSEENINSLDIKEMHYFKNITGTIIRVFKYKK